MIGYNGAIDALGQPSTVVGGWSVSLNVSRMLATFSKDNVVQIIDCRVLLKDNIIGGQRYLELFLRFTDFLNDTLMLSDNEVNQFCDWVRVAQGHIADLNNKLPIVHQIYDLFENYRIPVVSEVGMIYLVNWQDSVEIVYDKNVIGRLFLWKGNLCIHYRSARQGAIYVDDQVINQTGEAVEIGSFPLIHIKNGYLNTWTEAAEYSYLAGYWSVSNLRSYMVNHRYSPIGNALAIWDERVSSPDCLQPIGRAIYERIVKETGHQYNPELNI